MQTGFVRIMRRTAPIALVLCSFLYAARGPRTAGVLSQSAALPPGGPWWNLSDAENKENFRPVVATDVLDRVNALSIRTWNYKTQPHTVRHMGPTAQDFMTAFALGENEHYINTVDSDGVTMSAIQGLSQRLRETNDLVAEQTKRIDALETKNATLEARLKAVEARVGIPPANSSVAPK